MTHPFATGPYTPGHPWYYLLGGEVLPPKVIRATMRISGYQGYRAEEIRAVAAMAEPQRTRRLRQIREEVLLTLRADISRYREVVRELHIYRWETAGQPVPSCSAPVHTSVSLKHNHIYNDFAHLYLLDSIPEQRDLLDFL